ncbi:MAG: hypothetical protein ACRCVG_05575 [Methanobacteriaceae archaeon]
MNNPWNEIDLKTYEKHMQEENVYQLQTLNYITKKQLEYNPKNLLILGICG